MCIPELPHAKDAADAEDPPIFADIGPPRDPREQTQAYRLTPYRKAIMKQRRRGLTWKQIAAAMADPKLGAKGTRKAAPADARRNASARPSGHSSGHPAATSADTERTLERPLSGATTG
jgi:hypothetical protein